MTWAVWVALVFVTVILIELMRMNLLLIRNLGKHQEIERALGPFSELLPSVSIVIPAKDEQDHIEESVRSVMASDYTRFRLILVDDRSRDATRAIMERLAQGSSRISLVSVDHLPAGWTGKTHALSRGAEEATGDLILFSDADTILHPTAVSSAVGHLLHHGLDMLSLLPQFQERKFIENAIYPHLGLGLSSIYPLNDVNDPAKPEALASGCFILIRRQVYNEVGTWKRFRNEITEDIALSKAVKAHGFKLHVVRTTNLVRTKPFGRLSDVCRFWKRTLYGGLEKSAPKILRLTANYVVLTVLFAVHAASVALLLTDHYSIPIAVLTAISTAAVVLVIVPYGLVVREEGGSWLYGLTAPIGMLVSAWVAATALFAVLTGRGIRWRGSAYW
jgi:chlorobactene glucosyltransferase